MADATVHPAVDTQEAAASTAEKALAVVTGVMVGGGVATSRARRKKLSKQG